MGEPILRLSDISLSFKGIKALSNLSFDVKAGEICALIGPNGAGKSSLLNVMGGVYRVDDGEISFAGQTLSGAKPLTVARRGISRTFQHNALFKHLSVIDNVMAGLTRGLKRSTRFSNTHSACRALAPRNRPSVSASCPSSIFSGIAQHANAVVATLPYGVQKRLHFARALVSSPKLLLLDEPFLGGHELRREARNELFHS